MSGDTLGVLAGGGSAAKLRAVGSLEPRRRKCSITVRRQLEAENIAVTVSDVGHKFGAYGLHVGGSLAYDDSASQILIFRDTLTRDFGADRDELRNRVIRVVRHEVAHHLGAGEPHVRELGL